MTDKEKTIKELKEALDSLDITNKYRLNLIRAIEYLQEEPVSDDFKLFEKEYLEKEEDEILCVYDRHAGLVDSAQWQKEQFEKNRLKHCNSITNEQAELEQDFIDQHLNKYQRMPTFLDAIEYGMRLQKQQMIDKALDWAKARLTNKGYRDFKKYLEE